MREVILLVFAIAGGVTLSGIVACLYRLVAKKPENRIETGIHYAVMALAGPSIMFENATRSFRKKECTNTAYGFAVGLAAYWAFMLGAVMLGLVI